MFYSLTILPLTAGGPHHMIQSTQQYYKACYGCSAPYRVGLRSFHCDKIPVWHGSVNNLYIPKIYQIFPAAAYLFPVRLYSFQCTVMFPTLHNAFAAWFEDISGTCRANLSVGYFPHQSDQPSSSCISAIARKSHKMLQHKAGRTEF